MPTCEQNQLSLFLKSNKFNQVIILNTFITRTNTTSVQILDIVGTVRTVESTEFIEIKSTALATC